MKKLLLVFASLFMFSSAGFALNYGFTTGSGTEDYWGGQSACVPITVSTGIVPVGGITIHYIHFYTYGQAGAGTIQLRIYNAPGGSPGAALSAVTTMSLGASAAWCTSDTDLNLNLPTGATIYVGAKAVSANPVFFIHNGMSARYDGSARLADPWTETSGGSAANYLSSIYFDYTQGETLSTKQTAFRFRNDDGDESHATWEAGENTNITQIVNQQQRLRLQMEVLTSTFSTTPQIDYSYKNLPYVPVSTFQVVAVSPNVRAVSTIYGTTGVMVMTLPTGTTNNDYLLACIESTGNVKTPLGWTVLYSANTDETLSAKASHLTVLGVKVVPPNLPSTDSLQDPGDHAISRVIGFRGVSPTNPINTSLGGGSNAIAKTFNVPGVTTTVNNCMTYCVTTSSVDLSVTNNFSGATNSNLTGLTAQINNLNTSGNGGGFYAITGVKVVKGSVGGTSGSYANGCKKLYFECALTPTTTNQSPVLILNSPYIVKDGTSTTTAQLSVPSGLSSGDFSSGRISDDKNPMVSTTVNKLKYSEFETTLVATGTATTNDIFKFKLHGMTLMQTTTPQWTIGTPSSGGAIINNWIPQLLRFGQ